MLLSIHIKNYALIEELHLELGPGLNIFTGETGAGKSIIIESLGLILGERASAQEVRKGADRCFITAEFDYPSAGKLRDLLAESGMGSGDDILILGREIDAGGRSRAFINNRPASIALLKMVGEYLVDVHGQHEHQTLFFPSAQRELLDGFAGMDELKEKTAAAHRQWRELLERQDERQLSEQERERLTELYTYQLREIDDARVYEGEDEEIERNLPQLKNAEKLLGLAEEAHQMLYGSDGSVLERLGRTHRLIENINAMGGGMAETAENLQKALYQVEETAREVESFRDGLSLDPGKLNELLERQDLIRRLKKKYGQTIREILGYRERIAGDLTAISRNEEDRQELERRIEESHRALSVLCERLSAGRTKAGEKLAAAAQTELSLLGMKKARLLACVEKGGEPTAEGWDQVEFLFSPNQGEDPKPLRDIASGGEMSRVMLSLKTVLAKADRIPVLVFDEIDAGIGGPTGQIVGKKLKTLSRYHQVLCITHLPQIAAFGERHLCVAKQSANGRTFTQVRILSEADRLEEIARMLSGESITPAARRHASELITDSRQAC